MASLSEIRSLIFSYLLDSIDLPEFAERFEPMFYDIEETNDFEAIQLSYKVESVLAKASEGLLSVEHVREALSQCINGVAVPVKITEEYRDKSVVKLKQTETSSSYTPVELVLV